MRTIRVMVVDDSALMRKMIPQLLGADPELEVVGTAMDGLFALQKIRDLKPDVITLDVNMPRMDGIETLENIVRDFGIPVIMVSSLTREDAELTFAALEKGAFDFVTKPQDAISLHIQEIGRELIEKIKGAFENPLARMRIKKLPERPPAPARAKPAITGRSADKVLAIGSSTGGPNALDFLLPQFPKDFPAGILIAQHMPEGFTEMFAQRLNKMCRIEVLEAKDGDRVAPGRALIAPGNRHLRVRRLPMGSLVVLSSSPPVNGHRPSVDVLFRSVAQEYGMNATALIMTGMGADGADGIGEIKAGGGHAVAQDEKSCIVFGMPKAAIERDNVHRVLSLDALGGYLNDLFHSKEVFHGTEYHNT